MLKILSRCAALAAVAATSLLLASSQSVAQGTAVAPAAVAPANGKSLPHGVPFTFKVRLDADSQASGVFLKVSKSKKVGDDGTLANAVYFREMTAKGGLFVKKVERYRALTSHFLNRPGKYYWQPYAIDCSEGTEDCNVEGPINSFRIK